MDAGYAVLLGACVGAISSLIAQLIGAAFTNSRDEQAYARELRQIESNAAAEAYEYTLGVIYNMRIGHHPTRETIGEMVGKIHLRGTQFIREWLDEFLQTPVHERSDSNMDALIEAMRLHIRAIARNSRHPGS